MFWRAAALLAVLLCGATSTAEEIGRPVLYLRLPIMEAERLGQITEADADRLTTLYKAAQAQYYADDLVQEIATRRELVELIDRYYAPDYWLTQVERLFLASAEEANSTKQADKLIAGRQKYKEGAQALHRGDAKAAAKTLEEAEKLLSAAELEKHIGLLECRYILGRARSQAGDHEEAYIKLAQSLEMAEKLLGESHPAQALILHQLARVDAARGEYSAALAHLSRAGKIMKRHGLHTSHEYSEMQFQLVSALFRLERYDDTLPVLTERIALLPLVSELKPAEQQEQLLTCQTIIVQCLLSVKKPRQALSILDSLNLSSDQAPVSEALRRRLQLQRAAALLQLGHIDEAREAYPAAARSQPRSE